MMGEPSYEEKVTSKSTTALFVALTFAALCLAVSRVRRKGFGFLAAGFLGLFSFFLFYVLNYRRLIIYLTPQSLILRFGIFRWTVPLEDIEACYLDDISMWRIGGAGIHFTSIRRRYRAMFNFLEYPRVVIALRKKRGPVQEIAFSTRRPKEVMRCIQGAGSTVA